MMPVSNKGLMTSQNSIRFAVILFLLWIVGTSSGLTLEEAVAYAYEHNRNLAAVRLDVAKAEAGIDAALANFYPTLSMQGTFAYLSEVPVLSMSTGIPGREIVIPLGSHANYNAKLTLAQTLFAGGRLTNSYRLAQLGRMMAEDSVARKRQQLRAEVEKAFRNVLLIQEMLKLTEQSWARARDHLRVVIELQQQGFASRYDSLRTAVQVENLAPQIIRLQNARQLAIEALKLTIGMALGESLVVTGELTVPDADISEEQARNEALAQRIELAQLDRAIQALNLVRSITAGAYYPAVGLSASYDLKRPASMTGGGWGPSLTFALGLNYTLFDGLKTKAQLRQTELDIRKLEIMRQLLRDGIALEVKEALSAMQTARAALVAAESNIISAQEGVRLAEVRYAEGIGANLDVLDAQLALYQAEVNRLSAAKEYADAYSRLMLAIGKE